MVVVRIESVSDVCCLPPSAHAVFRLTQKTTISDSWLWCDLDLRRKNYELVTALSLAKDAYPVTMTVAQPILSWEAHKERVVLVGG